VLFTGFDPRRHLPPGRLLAGRTAGYNARIEATADRYGAVLIDLWSMPELTDPRLWSPDRLHPSPLGHLHVAGVVLERLGRPTPAGWPVALSAPVAKSRLRAGVDELTWSRRHLLPWVERKVRGRTAGDGRAAKQPALERWVAEQ
jgi:hypothetical protein